VQNEVIMTLDLNRYNDRVKDWMQLALQDMKTNGAGMNIVHRENSPSKGPSLDKLKAKEHFDDGAIDRIGFKMNRSLIWTHKGAGKGRGGTKGSSWTDAHGNRKTTDPDSLGKMATGGRTAKPWFTQFIESPAGVEDLATIAAEELGSAITNKLFI
jgi:hypothetical protein